MAQQTVIDLTQPDTTALRTPPPDHLSALPTELLHEIISYLFPTHYFLDHLDPSDRDDRSHPLLTFSSTNKFFRQTTNQWCNAWLHQHASITKYKDIKDTKTLNARNYITGRFGLLTWTRKHCVFCGKNSVRRAIMMNGLRCCKGCDVKEWDKITKTAAKREYGLRNEDLGIGVAGLERAPIRMCAYTGIYGWTEMMLRGDVERLADQVHGGLEEWKAKRQQRGLMRREKISTPSCI